MKSYQWYQTLRKPSWAPPQWLFGPVWTFLYIIITASFGYVAYQTTQGTLAFAVLLPFIVNLIFNLAFTPIQFGLKNNFLAMLDILAVLGTLIWALLTIYPLVHWVVFANIPYLLWTTFASVLQITITILNK